jgi:hypothetical protein
MYGEFATDPKVQMLSEAMQRRLVMLFCLECSNGIETFHVTERETSIAFALRVSEADLAETKALFMRKSFINDDWTLCNWSKRQYVSDSSTARVRAHRDKKRLEAEQRETDMKRSSNAPEQNRTDTEQIPPPIPREDDFGSRSKFAMTPNWEPGAKTFPAVLMQLGIAGQDFDQDLFLEFRSFWLASPDDHRTHAKWEHTLASHLKRNLRTHQASGSNDRGHDRSGSAQAETQNSASQGRRSSRQGARSVVDQARERLDARQAARQAAGETVVQDD